ncbi:MAG: hypothetical protein NTU61_03145 [Candidatus Altiarchaeota archaeon]|nr:hypothetical protein [Candidatus Altiarchaeota archaeon]
MVQRQLGVAQKTNGRLAEYEVVRVDELRIGDCVKVTCNGDVQLEKEKREVKIPGTNHLMKLNKLSGMQGEVTGVSPETQAVRMRYLVEDPDQHELKRMLEVSMFPHEVKQIERVKER